MQKVKKIFDREDLTLDIILLSAAFFLLFWAIGERSLWSSEGRWAEVTREMLTSGDFFHPTIGGEPYFDKPLLTYWVIAAFSAVTHRLDELIIRLPGALSGIVTLACTMFLGRLLWSAQVGRLAGGLLLTSYGLLMYSRVGSAETENLAAIMLAVTWYWTRRERPGFVTFLVLYLIIFIGSHMKGLTAFVVPVLVVFPNLLRERRWRWLFWPSHLLALGIGIIVYLTPFTYATLTQPEGYHQSGLHLVFQENILRYFKSFDHQGPVYQYLISVPLLTMPWVPILIGALITSVISWKKLDRHTRWLLQAILLIFIFFTLSGSRRDYYILPILPFCMLLMAVFLAEFGQEVVGNHRDRGLCIQVEILIVAAILEAVLGPVLILLLMRKLDWQLPSSLGWSFLIVGGAALLAGAVAHKAGGRVLRNTQLQTIWALIIMSGVLLGGFFVWQYNILESYRTERPFALRIKAAIESLPHERVAFWRRTEDKVLFYTAWDPPVTILTDENSLQTFLESDQPGLIISKGRYISETVASMLPSLPAYRETSYAWESPDKHQEKLKAWLINKDIAKFAIKSKEKNHAN
jgi:4-amino-4-deoxy-L-arabinose transferase-like glycosyltransferase